MIVSVERHGRDGIGRPDYLVLVFDDGTKVPLRRCCELFNTKRQTVNTRIARGHTDPAIVFADEYGPRTNWRDILHSTPAAAPKGWGWGKIRASKTIRQQTPGARLSRWREGRNDRA